MFIHTIIIFLLNSNILVNFGILSTDWHKTLINIFKKISF